MSSSAAMRVQISDPKLRADLVRYLRWLEYLAVEEGEGVTVVPINVLSARGDEARLVRDIEAWRTEHPGAEVNYSRESPSG
jgi:hypothetical protein